VDRVELNLPRSTGPPSKIKMNRFCIRHSHRGSSRAHRMILARVVLDRELLQQIVDEHDGCAMCWHDTALAAVDAAQSMLIGSGPLPEMDGNGLVGGPSVDWLLRRIQSLLDCEELDRRDLRG
jgi:hypothetical protein